MLKTTVKDIMPLIDDALANARLSTPERYNSFTRLQTLRSRITNMPENAIVELTSCMLDDINLFRSVE